MRKIDLRSVVIGILLVVAAMPLIRLCGNTPKAIKTSSITLVNEKGEECGSIGAREDGHVYLRLGGALGQEKFSVNVMPGERVQGGNVQLAIEGKRGYMRLTSGEYANAGPLIYMVNQQGRGPLRLGLLGDPGEGFLRIDDCAPNAEGVRGGNARRKTEGATIMIVGNDGTVTWSAP